MYVLARFITARSMSYRRCQCRCAALPRPDSYKTRKRDVTQQWWHRSRRDSAAVSLSTSGQRRDLESSFSLGFEALNLRSVPDSCVVGRTWRPTFPEDASTSHRTPTGDLPRKNRHIKYQKLWAADPPARQFLHNRDSYPGRPVGVGCKDSDNKDLHAKPMVYFAAPRAVYIKLSTCQRSSQTLQ